MRIEISKGQRVVLWIVSMLSLFSLFGCKAHMLDGPDMERVTWSSFTLQCRSCEAPYDFCFTVADDDVDMIVVGEYRDESGTVHKNETGAVVPATVAADIRMLNLDLLEGVLQPLSSETGDNGMRLTLAYEDGVSVEKQVPQDTAMQLYAWLAPCF